MIGPEVEPGVILFHLVAHLVTTLHSVLLQLLAILDATRTVVGKVLAVLGARSSTGGRTLGRRCRVTRGTAVAEEIGGRSACVGSRGTPGADCTG